MAVSKESLIYSYIFTFTLLSVVMTNVCQYFALHRPKKADCWGQWAPTVLMMMSTLLILVAPLKNLVVNICMQSFRENGFDSTIEHVLDIAYLPVFGERPQRWYTLMAYVLMFWATALQVDAPSKFKALVREKQVAKAMKGFSTTPVVGG